MERNISEVPFDFDDFEFIFREALEANLRGRQTLVEIVSILAWALAQHRCEDCGAIEECVAPRPTRKRLCDSCHYVYMAECRECLQDELREEMTPGPITICEYCQEEHTNKPRLCGVEAS